MSCLRRRQSVAAFVGIVSVCGILSAPGAGAIARAPRLGFAKPVAVDGQLAGGEPFVLQTSPGHLIYSSHEGTTHLLRDGIATGPTSTAGFASNYRNQVNMWTSKDNGRSWQRVNYAGTGFFTNPATNSGFSDPDLTRDDAGIVYNTGINLANDALFSSPDGGRTWPTGTINCHDGDRPWLAGGHPREVFLATDTAEGGVSGSGHTVFRSTDAGASCGASGITDNGGYGTGTYSGFGKLYYDHLDGSLIEPAEFMDSSGTVNGVGVSVLPKASAAFGGHAPAVFQPHRAAKTSVFAHWPSIAVDRGNTLYVVWDTAARKAGSSGGCMGAPTLLPNSIMMASSRDHGRTWSAPVTVAHPGTTVLWPWIQAGADGSAAVVWYQYDRLTDPDCGTGNVRVEAATVFGAHSPRPKIERADVAGRVIHTGGICQGGTTCVATGQDRRLGDFLTNAVDPRGCLLVATGDTTRTDPVTGGQLPTSRPLFIRQNSGMGLLGTPC